MTVDGDGRQTAQTDSYSGVPTISSAAGFDPNGNLVAQTQTANGQTRSFGATLNPAAEDTQTLTTVLLLRSEHIGWDGVWNALRQCPEIRLVEAARSADWVLAVAAEARPALIVAPIGAAWADMPALLVGLHERWPDAKIALLGELPSAQGLQLLREANLRTYLGWDEVLPNSLWVLLRSALTLDLRIASGSLLRQYPLSLDPRPETRPQAAPPALTPIERDVLSGLAAGLTRAEIAAERACGLRTVHSAVARLRRRFGVRNDFQLGTIAGQLGLLAAA